MPIPRFINSLEDVNESFREHYVKRGEKFVLDVSGDEDTTALRNAKDREKKRADEEANARRELEKEFTTLQRKLSDLESNPEVDKLRNELDTSKQQFDKLTGSLSETAKLTEAQRIAGEISKAPKLLSRFIADRLTVELDENFKPRVRPLNGELKLDDKFSIDDLKKEFAESPDFADIIIASKASGGGASRGGTDQSQSGRGAFNSTQQNNAPVLANISPAELVAHIEAKKQAGG